MSLKEDIYLGKSLKFPISIDQFGKAETVGGRESVAQSILDLLETPFRDSFFVPERGSRLEELTFEPNDNILKPLLRTFIFEVIKTWEKRVDPISIDFEFLPDQSLVNCSLQVRIKQSNEIESLIWPFYRELTF